MATEDQFLVALHDSGPSGVRKLDPAKRHGPLGRELEQELIDTRRELQSTIEQLETTDEDHRAGQEELQAIHAELQSIHEELQASKEALETKNAELECNARRSSELIAMLGHELRNPAGAIVNGTELLRSVTLPAAETEVLGMIERQGKHLRRLLDDLLDAARISSGRFKVECEPLDLAAAVRVAIEGAKPLFQQAEVDLATSLAPEGALVVRGDTARLTQLVANLLVNAARYTLPGGRVSLELACEEGQATIRVSDTGIGISRASMPHIFDTFSQGPAPGCASHGLGLGLLIVREIARLHDGDVSASSGGEGQGSEFKVTLPWIEHALTGSRARVNLGG